MNNIDGEKRRKSILHIIDSISLGGAEILLRNTISLFDEFDHIVVFLINDGQVLDSFSKLEIKLVCLEHKSWSNLPLSIYKLRKIIKKEAPYIVHSHLFYSTICARLAMPSSVALISTLHSLYSKDAFEKNIISVWAERLLLKNRYALVAVSRYVLEDYLHYVPFKGKTFVLYNFLPDSFFQKHKRLKSGELKCVAIGNLKEAKNYPFLLDIFKELKGSGISLDVYGEGLLRNQLQDQIHREGLQVKLCGETNSISDVLSQYDLFIQASSHEGFGISVIEAMAASLPVYVSDIPVFREITGNFAFFFSLSSPNSAAQNLKDFKENVALRNQHVKQAYNYCRLHYSEKIYKQKLLQIYNDVTSGS